MQYKNCVVIIKNFSNPKKFYCETLVSDILLGVIINLDADYYILESIHQLIDLNIGLSNGITFIYNINEYAAESAFLINLIPRIKKFHCKIVVVSDSLPSVLIKKLYGLDVDIVVQPSSNYDIDIDNILSVITGL